jgi:hypothetical protein
MQMLLRPVALFGAVASMYAVIGCTADIHDNEVNVDADLTFSADVDADGVKPGDSISVSMKATGVVLVDPDDEPSAPEKDKAAYFEIFLDDEDGEPLTVTASATASVTIPSTISKGEHHLICRLKRHDGMPTNQKKEVSFTVSASATATTTTTTTTTDAGMMKADAGM